MCGVCVECVCIECVECVYSVCVRARVKHSINRDFPGFKMAAQTPVTS